MLGSQADWPFRAPRGLQDQQGENQHDPKT